MKAQNEHVFYVRLKNISLRNLHDIKIWHYEDHVNIKTARFSIFSYKIKVDV